MAVRDDPPLPTISPTRSRASRPAPRAARLAACCILSDDRTRPTTWPRALAAGGDAEGHGRDRGRADRRPRTARPHLVFAAGQRPVRLDRPAAGARASDRRARDEAADAGRRRGAGRSDRRRRRRFASTSSGRTICWSAGASWPASSPRRSGTGGPGRDSRRARLRHQRRRRRFRRTSATARRRSSPSWDAPVDRAALLRGDDRRAGAALPRSARRPVRCYSRRVAQPFAVEPSAPASRGTTPAGAASGVDRRHRRQRRVARARRRSRRRIVGELVWPDEARLARVRDDLESHAASDRRRQHQHRPRRVRGTALIASWRLLTLRERTADEWA